ncbi:hypothetical protein ACKWTF_001580 [Chironomus riparius]
MDFISSQQKRILDDFVEQTSSLIELGFAYSAAHESYLKKLDCHHQKIKMIKNNQRANPMIGNCYDRMLMHEYIHYIFILIRAGLNYVKNNPKYLDKVDQVQRVLNEHGKFIRNSKAQFPSAAYFEQRNGRDTVNHSTPKRGPVNEILLNQTYVKPHPNLINQNPVKQQPNTVRHHPNPIPIKQQPNTFRHHPNLVKQQPNTFSHQPNPVKPYSVNQHPNLIQQHPNPVRARTFPARHSPSTDDNNAFKDIYDHMNNLSIKIDEIRNKTYNLDKMHSTPRSSRSSSDCLKKFDNEISKQLLELQSKKKIRMKQREKANKVEQTMPKKNLNNMFDPVIRDEDGDIKDSFFEYPSEVIVYNETFIKQQQPPKIGRIERNIVIPIQVDENQKYPKIKPFAYFEEANDGSMRINVHLEFDEKVLCNDKLVNQIKVRNLLTM